MNSEIKQEFPEYTNINERTEKSIDLYKKIARETQKTGWEIIFTSGFAFDANVGHVTRNHKDIDLMISKDESIELTKFLRESGHDVYVIKGSEKEILKIDGLDPLKPDSAHGDIHLFWNDGNGKATIPLLGKLLKFSTDSKHLYNEIEFLGVKQRFLKPKYLLEEKIGWVDQIGLPVREQDVIEKDRISKLISLTE